VQVDPIKPKLKPPVTKRLKPKLDTLLSTFAFKLNLRRYDKARPTKSASESEAERQGPTLVHFSAQLEPILTQSTP